MASVSKFSDSEFLAGILRQIQSKLQFELVAFVEFEIPSGKSGLI
jgi:hypothetical protein